MRLGRGVCCVLGLLTAVLAHAAGPRWVAGPPWWNYEQPMTWYTNNVTYWLDSGDLSTFVSHDAAVALVNAAAGTWNIPSSNLRLALGGTLAEDVDGSNVYLGSDGPIWPSDVDSANYPNAPIAVVLDADGTLTDMLLGEGASAPSNCRTAAVTETVDLFIQPGKIAHAVLVLNGRCTGPAPEQQMQMRYQLMRAFGRIIGLGWSQTNDNVFTGAPAPTYQQQMHWPIMHPIDVLCGVYTYQCLPEPFTLRDDDVASVDLLYANGTALQTATGLAGYFSFPDGRQAAGINIALRRSYPFGTYGSDPYEDVSAVTGYTFKGNNGNPIGGLPTGNAAWQGTTDQTHAGFWLATGIPVVNNYGFMNLSIEPQRVNPLYVGQYAVGPYGLGSVDPPAGLPPATQEYWVGQGGIPYAGNIQSTAPTPGCAPTPDMNEVAPAKLDGTGRWTSRLCTYGQSSWTVFPVRAGRSATVEVSALDEKGAVSSNKAMPVMGLWHAADPAGTDPTIAAVTSAFNGRLNGLTQMVASFDTAEDVRLGLSDERGEGRPDFGYTARVLYADTVEPATLPASGGAVRIFGMGFQPGNIVTVDGVRANVTRISATEIDATVAAATLPEGGADVTVTDLRTGGSTTMTGVLFGSGASSNLLHLVSGPTGNVPVGLPTTLALRLTDASGAPVVNGSIIVSVRAGSAGYRGCLTSSCTWLTDRTGLAQGLLQATAAGPVTLEAIAADGASLVAQFTAVAPTRVLQPIHPVEYVAAGAGAPFLPGVTVLENGAAIGGELVHWSSPGRQMQLLVTDAASDAAGHSSIAALASLNGGEALSLSACAWAATPPVTCTALPLVGVAPENLRIAGVSGLTQTVATATDLLPVLFRVTDRAGHGVAGATVAVHQSITAWQPACPATGRCPTPALYETTSTAVVSDDDGLFSVAPLQSNYGAGVTHLTVATGTSGYASTALTRQP